VCLRKCHKNATRNQKPRAFDWWLKNTIGFHLQPSSTHQKNHSLIHDKAKNQRQLMNGWWLSSTAETTTVRKKNCALAAPGYLHKDEPKEMKSMSRKSRPAAWNVSSMLIWEEHADTWARHLLQEMKPGKWWSANRTRSVKKNRTGDSEQDRGDEWQVHRRKKMNGEN
jgi:hypothetical protein